jgi:AraC-like DNA-binding protein/mannose-6-phosphate isomerase-like protein (cupin superfamily)
VSPEARRRVKEGFPGQRLIVLPRPVVAAWLGAAPLLELLPTDVGHFPRAQWHYVERPEGVPQLVLIYCVHGEGWLRLDETWRVRAGQALVIPPGVPHAYGADEASPWTIYWVHMGGLKARRAGQLVTAAGDGGAGAPVFYAGLGPELPPLFEEILDLLGRGYTSTHLFQASACLGRLVATFAEHAGQQGSRGLTLDDRIERVIETMHRRLGVTLSVAQLAAEAQLSPSHFAAIFKRKTGFSVRDFFTRLKIQRAGHLLDSTDLPVKAIAADLGFEDPLYFSRCFRRIHECPPTRYRTVRKG